MIPTNNQAKVLIFLDETWKTTSELVKETGMQIASFRNAVNKLIEQGRAVSKKEETERGQPVKYRLTKEGASVKKTLSSLVETSQ